MLDFSKLSEEKKIIAPILNNSFQYHSKKYRVHSEDGWFLVIIKNNKARILEQVYTPPESYDTVKGFTYNNKIIFHNFDVAKRKWKFDICKDLNFNTSQTFSPIEAVVWEDKNIYFSKPDYTNYKIFELKAAFDSETTLNEIKGITPELRTLFLFHTIERDNIRELEKQVKAKEELKKMMESLPYRLKVTFERSGATMTNYSLSGKRIIVDWTMPGSSYNYNSVIDADSFMIIEAGYCLSGGDKKLNITAMIKTAEEYEERGVTYITRD